ncbi:hypothetical protein FSARC_14832 [Fusarium sarcochroum]|uniref:N-acetyltransferase domain-containing protein n=1 Tax=Fusarium sarcochroum TaxID=1208366 RepID=A0A8H4SQL6_9HYPO|nr:hypothetical protein FSARC_14832 [Fusarium sarcochroum]
MGDSVSISAAILADLPVLGDFLYSSKLALSINRLLIKDWPNEENQRKNYSSSIETSLSDPTMECLKAVDNVSGNIVGFVVLENSSAEAEQTSDDESTTKRTAPDWMDSDLFSEVMEGSAFLDQQSETFDHFSVIYIYVAPTSRRKGIGSKLLETCRDRAKTAGIPLVAVSEPASHPFFKSLAFEDGAHYEFDLTEYAMPYSGFGPFRLTRTIWSGDHLTR